jgi:integrase
MASVWIRTRRTKGGDDRHRVEYRVGGRDTKTQFAGSFKTKRLAILRAAWIERELAEHRVPDLRPAEIEPSSPTFAVAARRWLDSRVDVSEGTKLQNRTSINRAMAVLRDRRIDELEPEDIADLVVLLHSEGVAVGYLRKVCQAIAMTLDHAGVTPNPARNKLIVRMPRNEPEEMNPPTAEHVAGVYRLLPTAHRLPLLFLDWSGARVSAIDHALVGDYDEQRRRVRLRAATTKTRRALWIDLHPVIAGEIERRLPPRDDRDLRAQLFAGTGSDALRTAIARACRAAGVPLFSPHDLRHRRISLLHLNGTPWARIGEFVGQRNLATTANTYSHVLMDEAEVDYAALLIGT